MPEIPHDKGGDPLIGRLVRDAYWTAVDVETASRHLWRLHQVAGAPAGGGARRTLVSALVAVLLFASSAVAVALSGEAVPGDSLYLVKRGAERVHLLVSFAPESDARLHLRFARARAVEAQRVAASRPDRVPVLLSEIVAAVDRAQVVSGGTLSGEVEMVRQEVSVALAALNTVLDAELAESVDATVQELENGRAVTGSRHAPNSQAPAAEGPGGTDGPGAPQAPATEQEQSGPVEAAAPGAPGATSEPVEVPSTPAVEQSPAAPVEGSTAPPLEEPSGPATGQPGGGTPEAPAGTRESTRSEPAGTPEDTAIPILDRLEALLEDPDPTP